ncbi:urease accessory protein UreD [Psychromarinibacter halotolerans]|uniref:Urease accessory protein UreD n=1 Tax=Psychromarinibacter halotolerans TaxID=1775175 RepID=A0ABV7GRC8_9RHOB|nr:urease accessory protein UreD [Psychromarinibacter halotolerans]MDF0595233.1 urease accessory protein UreD [Psychromarinibacter halotolerans]
MYDETLSAPQMQRAKGRATVSFVMGKGRARLKDLHQSGSAKAMLPRVHSETPEVVFLNTAGGLTGGDDMRFSLEVGAGCRVTATTQTAERAYAASAGHATLDVDIRAGAGAHVDWLPQETILFERSALHRRTRIALDRDAACLTVETLVLGRAAMGETLTTLDVTDRREVTRDGVPVLLEPLRLTDAALARGHAPGVLGGARAMATVALVAPGAEDALDRVRAVLDADGVEAAASGWDGKCVVRALAHDGFPLRRLVAQVLMTLRPGPLPRVWQI